MINISCVSLDQIWLDKEENLKKIDYYAGRASSHGSDIVVFPEMTTTGFSMNADAIAEGIDCSETVKKISEIARKHKIWVIAGLVIKLKDQINNSAVVINSFGELISKYDKIHPFSFTGEDQFYSAGSDLKTFVFNNVTIGLSICYDLRFPEMFSALASKADIVVNIANWPHKRVDHWSVLLRARAIENQIFMIGVNRTGTDGNGLNYSRSTYIYNANGVKVIPIESDSILDVFQLSITDLNDFRKSFPTTKDRRPNLYEDFIRTEYE